MCIHLVSFYPMPPFSEHFATHADISWLHLVCTVAQISCLMFAKVWLANFYHLPSVRQCWAC